MILILILRKKNTLTYNIQLQNYLYLEIKNFS